MADNRSQFQVIVADLVKNVRVWAESNEWVTKIHPKKMRDGDRNIFEVPALLLQKGPARLLLDPVAYDVPGSQGVVDLYLMPTYDDVASLYCEEGQWSIHYGFPPDPIETHSGIENGSLPLSEENIIKVLNSIAENAVPSF